MQRTRWYALGIVSVALCATGCQKPAAEDGGKIVQVGTTKGDLLGMPSEYRSIHPRLEEITGGRVAFDAQPNASGIAERLRQGLIQYAILSPGEFASIQDVSQIKPIAVGINSLGKSSRKAYIVVKAGSHVKAITDCKGKRFAFGVYKDLLTDKAAQAALEAAGVPVKDLLIELLTPPPLGLEGRLYVGKDTAKTIANDPTVNAGVIDEVEYSKLKETGGSFLLGPSKDQLTIVGETIEVPELVVVAGPAADAQTTEKLKSYLLNDVDGDARVCADLGVSGFAEPKAELFSPARSLAQSTAK